ncbi:hypothetical protein CXG81DRAFT_21053 [Caulochytrium protostelioides]|uniref:Extracellular membrane protein CFEM domain-containing protein n=1 Tax=Caulochytrium protostelioides TaxID=1555241 RepID=A0A4P9WW64_9FUNG|nr:hypothetical protein CAUPRSCDRAFT_11543 [Caulochytrium protostelioides]RKO98787.1 hypothetical protein CXG81DRAFT_21053 [Caulochytrium protostelioides]|eukprot:RKO98787.1 hypothetical protein CXG81DRAFT_21053 [Caulochytrium protostelioides]
MYASTLSLAVLAAAALVHADVTQFNQGCPADNVPTFDRCIEDAGINASNPTVDALCLTPPNGMSADQCRCTKLTMLNICYRNSCPDAVMSTTYKALADTACSVSGVTTPVAGTFVPVTATASGTSATATTGSGSGSSSQAKSGAAGFTGLVQQLVMPALISLGGLAGLVL